ncbi:MAG: hypothetical protein IJF18_02110 [Oscillospiraceae bacterium]|nr:hypothetical protein [Oscillospiraceae bacterium]
MIHLNKIVKEKNNITCIAFVEDCKQGVQLSLNITTQELEEISLPQGYEWCTAHIWHAKQYLISLIGENIVPESRTIMWY